MDCPACGTTGIIQCVMPRIPERVNSKEIALSGDLCICQCSPPPKLIAEQTAKCQIIRVANEKSAGQAQA